MQVRQIPSSGRSVRSIRKWGALIAHHFDGDFAALRPGVTYRWRLVEHRERAQKPLSLSRARRGLRLTSLYDLAART
jgi:hypothetical protein